MAAMIDTAQLLSRLEHWSADRDTRRILGIEMLALTAACALVILFGPYSFYSPAGYLDPWIPTGYFLNFEDLLHRFHYTYYVSRLPYVVPGLAVYSIFTPVVANFVLNLLFLALATLSLYSIVMQWVPKALAMALALVFALNAYTVSAFAWDYSDGPAIAYTLAAIAVGRTVSVLPEWRRMLYVGALFLMAGACNLIAGLVVAPAAVWLWLSASLKPLDLLKRGLGLVGGVVLGFVGFSIVSKGLVGTSRFLGPQMDQFRFATRTEGLLADMWGTGFAWILESPRLWTQLGLLALGLVVLLARSSARSNRTLIGALLFYAATAAAFLWVEFGMQAVVLRVFYHSSYLLVPAFLFLGALVAWAAGQAPDSLQRRPLAFGAIVVFASLCIPAAVAFAGPLPGDHVFPWLIAVLMGSVAAAGFLSDRAVGIAVICLMVSIASASSLDRKLRYAFNDNATTFRAAIAASNVLRYGIPQSKRLQFWFDADEPHANVFHSINSLYLWGWRDLSGDLADAPTAERSTSKITNLPKPKPVDGKQLSKLFHEGTVIVHLTTMPAKVHQRQATLASLGIHTRWRGDRVIQVNNLTFHLVLT